MNYVYKTSLSLFILLTFTLMVLAQNDKSDQEAKSAKQSAVVKAFAPIFSAAAIATNSSGKVIVAVKINKSGFVNSTQATEGHALLRHSAEIAAKFWEFVPVNDEKENTIYLTFIFSILPKETPIDQLAAVFTMPYQVEVKTRLQESPTLSDPVSDKYKQKRKKH